jgi:PAS domain S-box-containing protein
MGPVVRIDVSNPKHNIRELLALLGSTEQQLSLAIESAELGVWHWSPTTGEVLWSEQCRRLLDASAEVVPTLDAFLACVHEGDRDAVRQSVEEAVASGNSHSMEFRVPLQDGGMRWLHSLCRLSGYGSADDLPRMSGVLRDLTTSREAADTLARHRQLEEQTHVWAGVFAHSAAAMSVVDPSTCTIRSANAAYCRLSGYSSEELAGKPARAWYAPDQAEILLATEQQSDRVGHAHAEILRLHKDGTAIPTTLDMVSVKGPSGEVQYRVVTIGDLREHARIQARLRHHEAIHYTDQRFRLLAESAPIGIVLADPDGSITYANPAWLATTAIPLGQALSMDWFELVHPDDRDRVMGAWQRTRDGAAFDLEFRYRRPSGEARWVQAHASELKDEEGQSLGFVRTSLDVTDRLLERAATDRFHSQVRSLAQRLQELREIERNEIAGTLQDSVYQGLVGLKAEAFAMVERAPEGTEEARVSARFLALSQATLEGLRRVLFALTPPGIAELGFAAALKRYADEQAAQSGCRITISLPADPVAVHQQTLMVVYSAAKEAIENALEHAKPSVVDVAFEVIGGTARLRVSDNGIGIGNKDRMKPGCFGLLAASERLAQIGGTLRVMGIGGRGTIFEASVPARKAALRPTLPY